MSELPVKSPKKGKWRKKRAAKPPSENHFNTEEELENVCLENQAQEVPSEDMKDMYRTLRW